MAKDKKQERVLGLGALAGALGMATEEPKKEAKTEKKAKQPVKPVVAELISLEGMEEEKQAVAAEKPKVETSKKSSSKAAGVKSVFTMGDGSLLMTSFGRGNDAVLEKNVTDDNTISDINTEAPVYSAKVRENGFTVKGRASHAGSVDDPRKSAKRPDQIDCREQIERRFFGKTYEDNIHIQMAYNVMDIEKILAVHVNNVVYALNNILGDEEAFYADWIGCMGWDKTYEKAMSAKGDTTSKFVADCFRNLMRSKRRAYFGDVLFDAGISKITKKEIKEARIEEERKKAYYICLLLGKARQMTAHDLADTRSALYCLDESFDAKCKNEAKEVRAEVRAVLDELYYARVSKLNSDFIDTSKKDLVLLFRAFGIKESAQKKEYAGLYYDFVVRKNYKFMGFSIKELREIITKTIPEAAVVKDEKYDTVRQKLNRLFDFAIYDYYRKNPAEADSIVCTLRAVQSETDKQLIYRRSARQLWKSIRATVLSHILPNMNGDAIKAIVADPDITADALKDVLVSANANYFVKFLYMLTRFQNGKEINDLITTCINKFENIASFITVLEERHIGRRFAPEYGIFERSAEIAMQLREMNNFARMSMKSDEVATKKAMFEDAALILGYENTAELDSMLDRMLDPKGTEKGFRNFIVNNVIESVRFDYLVRYCNPTKVRKLASNAVVLGFVLKGIPDDQILRYYNSCTGSEEKECAPRMRGELTQKLEGISFNEFKDVHQQDATATAAQAQDKVRKQAIIRLYLAVLYLLVKNMVYVNSRYFMAFHCLERDNSLYTGTEIKKDDYASFARAFMQEERHRKNVRAARYIDVDFANSDPQAVREYRNCVEHLSAVRHMYEYIGGVGKMDSYFDLYHYIVQRHLADQNDRAVKEGKSHIENPKMLGFIANMKRYNGCSKDMIKALNVPFAYNLARFKNLSVDGLFDMNDTREKPEGRNCGMETEEAE